MSHIILRIFIIAKIYTNEVFFSFFIFLLSDLGTFTPYEKSVYGLYFPTLGLNTDINIVNFCI